jgi:tetratricopeptide (TPR) repeat protein
MPASAVRQWPTPRFESEEMDVRALLSGMSQTLKGTKRMTCVYCGTDTPIIDGKGICSWCENLILREVGAMEKLESMHLDRLGDISTGIAKGKFDDVMKIYDGIETTSKEPGFPYAHGLALVAYSNQVTSMIEYNRKGFMEENIVYRDKAAALYSTARLKFNRAISLSDTNLWNGERANEMLYTSFLAQIKLGKLKAAQFAIESIKNLGDVYLWAYSDMIMAVALEKYEEALKHALGLTEEKHFSANAYYYIAFCLFKKRQYKDAEMVASKLSGIVSTAALSSLNGRIREAMNQ